MEGCAPPHRCLAGDGASPRPLGGSTRPIGCHLGLFLAPTRAAALRAPKSYSPSRREGSFSETQFPAKRVRGNSENQRAKERPGLRRDPGSSLARAPLIAADFAPTAL